MAGNGGPPARGPVGWIRTNRGFAAGVLVVCLALAVYQLLSPRTFIVQRDGFYLGFFPLLGIGLMAISAAVMLFDRFRSEEVEDLVTLSWRFVGYVALMTLAGYAFFWLTLSIGYLIMAPLYLAILTYWLGVRPLYAAVISALVMAVGVYALFRLIGIELPAGLLPI